MKLFRIAISLQLLLFLGPNVIAQGNNGGNIEPVQICSANTLLCTNQITPNPNISVNSDLPDIEYLIIDESVAATNGSGPAIVGIDGDGVFIPSTFGVMPGSNIEVIPIAYNLAAIQNTVNDILKGQAFGGSVMCCALVGTACTDLNNSGIFCGSDVTSLEGIFPLLNATDLLSISDFVSAVMEANTQLQSPFTPMECGGTDFIAYAYGNSCTYSVLEDFVLLNLPDHSLSEVIIRSDYIESGAFVANSLIVDYLASSHIELVSPFEVELGAVFLADILTCQ